jgi:glycosyltransferase involved in cell wall biosynthesis
LAKVNFERPGRPDLRLAVVSPFLDRYHGTELCLIEQIERLVYQHGWTVHIYSQRVENVEGLSFNVAEDSDSRIFWHRVSDISGPHVLKFIWWFLANHLRRWRDFRNPDRQPDVVYSPGINCIDADAIIVHIVFHEFCQCVGPGLRLRCLPISAWPRTIHRKLYYQLLMLLERRIYRNPQVRLAAVSQLVADKLLKHFQRADVTVIPNGVDTAQFFPGARLARRCDARKSFGFDDTNFILLLIGNDWKNKGLDQLLQAMTLLMALPFRLLVVGSDDPLLYDSTIRDSHLQDRVCFQPTCHDVLSFYAAADAYVGPSLEDAFALPVLEAMACGLPVIASARAGVSELIEDGRTGLILRLPEDSVELAALLKRLCEGMSLRQQLGEAAAQAAKEFNWEKNAAETAKFLGERVNMHSNC